MSIRKKFFRLSFTFILITGFIVFIRVFALAAEEVLNTGSSAGGDTARTLIAFAAMGSVGLSCMTSAYALSRIGSAAMGAMSEKPELGGRALIFLGMAEGIAIYGLIIAIMLINKM